MPPFACFGMGIVQMSLTRREDFDKEIQFPHIFLFFCKERSAHHIQKEVEAGHWKAPRASQYDPCISHLFFAYDLLLFADNTCSQIRVIKKMHG